MKIEKNQINDQFTLSISGRLDTSTAPQLDAVITDEIKGTEKLVVDCGALEYVSSAGLRVLLKAHKKLAGAGSMKLTGVNETIMEVFEITGFTDILNIEQA